MAIDRLRLITPPTAEPVDLSDMKLHLRETDDGQDPLIEDLTTAARLQLEDLTGRAWMTQVWELALPAFPTATRDNPLAAIIVPRPPLVSVTSIGYTDLDGALQTLAAALYVVDTRADPGQIVPAYEQTWPDTRDIPNAVIVTFTAGYGTNQDVPEPLRHALKIQVATLYEHREALLVGQTVTPVPTVAALLERYRIRSF